MAAIALEKLEDRLNCSICLDTYTNPKLLQCFHVYCQQCLVRLVDRDQQGQLILTCPNCRQVTPTPAGGVAGLQSAFHINQLLEIVKEYKKANLPIVSPERAENSSADITRHRNTTVCCPEHDEREVELYCETCGETICFKCIMKDEKHHSHNYEELSKAFEKYKGEITSFLEPMEKHLENVERTLAQLDVHCAEISDQQTTIETDIHNTITQLHEKLDIRKTELIGQLHQLTQAKLKSLAAKRDQIEITQAQLSSCLHFIRESLETGNQADVLLMKSATVRQVKKLTTKFQPDLLNTEADMIFSTLADITKECQNFGRICTATSPDPSKCYTKGKISAAVGDESSTVLHTFCFNNQPCRESVNSIRCDLVSEIMGNKIRGRVERREKNKYEISFQPTIKGKHLLHIEVEGKNIRGSPFIITAKSPVEKLGTPILTINGLERPAGVAINQKGEVVVAEWDGQCISIFSPSGKKLRSFAGKYSSSSEGQFRSPRGVAVDSEENVLVTDCAAHCVHKFTSQGNFLEVVGSKGTGPLQFDHPMGIAHNASNDMVYVGSDNGSIQTLNFNFDYQCAFGKKGSGKGQFNDPRLITCDNTGNVYVADCNNHRIQVFTADGRFLRMFGKHGEGKGELHWPCGVAVDSNNLVYVSELQNNRISIFTSEGEFVTSFGCQGEGPGEFNTPYGLAVDNSGVVYVCDYKNNRVQIF